MTEPKPMDPERLARCRAVTSPCGHSWLRLLMAELLADRDYHQRRADAAESKLATIPHERECTCDYCIDSARQLVAALAGKGDA